MITWILDKHVDRVRGAPTPFIDEAQKRGHKIYGLRDSIIPKAIDLTGVVISEHTIVRGSHGFVNYVQKELNPLPGGFLHPTNFQLATYAPILGEWCLNNDFFIIEYGVFVHNRYEFGRVFVKPLDEMKKFSGIVLESRQDLEQAHRLKYGKFLPIPETTKMIVSPAKEIDAEFRIIVVDGKPITGSTYDITKPNVPDDVMETAETVAKIWNPADVYVVDIAQTSHGNKVIEYNQFSTSAIYACDQGKIVDALENYCVL